MDGLTPRLFISIWLLVGGNTARYEIDRVLAETGDPFCLGEDEELLLVENEEATGCTSSSSTLVIRKL